LIAKIAKKFRKGRKAILVKELLSMEQMLTYAGPELGECVAAHLARDAQAGTPEGVSYAGMDSLGLFLAVPRPAVTMPAARLCGPIVLFTNQRSRCRPVIG